MPVCPTVIHIVSPTEFGPIFRCQNLLYRVAIATARPCFSLQCETLDSEPCIKSKAGLASEISSVTETILSPWTVCESPHFGQDAICVAGGSLGSASARTFTRVPHLQRHATIIPTIIVSNASGKL